MHIKKKAKVLGLSGGRVNFEKQTLVPIVLTLFRNPVIEAVNVFFSCVDNQSFTKDLITQLERTTWKQEVRAILLETTFIAGLSLIEVDYLATHLDIPVIVIYPMKPDLKKIKIALKHIEDEQYKKHIVQKLLEYSQVISLDNGYYYNCYNINNSGAQKVLSNNTLHGKVPEPVRLASMIAKAIQIPM